MNRGIIAAPGIISKITDGFIMERPLTLEELNYYCLYWDEIVIPTNNLLHISLPQQESFLSAEAIKRPKIDFRGSYRGSEIAEAILSSQSIVAKELVKDKNTDWVIQQFGTECILPNDYGQSKNTLRIELASCLPVPTGQVNIHDILEFKHQRGNELKALHNYMELLYQEILNSPDETLAEKKAFSEFLKSIEDLNTVAKERFGKTSKYDLSTELNIGGKDTIPLLLTGAIEYSTNNSILLTAIGAAISILKISAKYTKTFQPAENNIKLAYLTTAKKDGIL